MRSFAISTAAAIFVLLGCASAANAPALSWGKAGVSYDQYRNDAAQCSFAGLNVVVAQHSAESEAPALATDSGDFLMRVHRNDLRRWHQEMLERQAMVDRCLKELGYRQFRLTADQRTHLDTLPPGTQQRHEYLYNLASSQEVLNAQGL